MNPFTRTRLLIILIAAFVLGFQQILSIWPVASEAYLAGVYPYLVRTVFGLFTWIPLPLVYVCFGALIFAIVAGIRKAYIVSDSPMSFTALSALHLLTVVMFLAGTFSLFWGYNYTALSLEDRMELPEVKVDTSILFSEFHQTVAKCEVLRNRISYIMPSESLDFRELNKTLEQDLKIYLALSGYPVLRSLPVKPLYPKGLMLRLSAAGFYCPWAGEGYIDPALHPLQVPFTMAHEMAHVAGITDEGEANLMAWIACRNSADHFVRYSAELAYLRYLLRNIRQYNPAGYQFFTDQLPESIQSDIRDIHERMQKYPDFFPRSREIVYERYLQAQGIEDGLQSYNRMVDLVIRYKSLERLDVP